MSLGSKPCPCGGDNPNCFRCWGTGMFGGKSSEDSTQGSYLGSRVKPSPGSGLTQCRECGAYVSGLLAHMQQDHGPKPRKKVGQSSESKTQKGKTILLAASLARAGSSPKKPPKRSGLRVSPELKCPKCKATFPNITQLTSHVIGSHGRKAYYALDLQAPRSLEQNRAEHNRAKNNRATPGRAPTAVEKDTTSPDSANQEQRLDAKRYWGHSFRDHGQFGSYPSHDDMDDES